MAALVEYKCPNCGGTIKFDSNSQQFKCESCDSIFTKEQLSQYDSMINPAEESCSDYNW